MLSQRFLWIYGITLVFMVGCNLASQPVIPTQQAVTSTFPVLPTATPAPIIPSATPQPWQNANDIMRGICFESALDAVGNIFVIRNNEELIRFYDLADQSRLCPRKVRREIFDFSDGRILFGLWTSGMGCTANHEVMEFNRNETEKTISVQLRFFTQGDCNYELVRPFWVSVNDAQEHKVNISFFDDN